MENGKALNLVETRVRNISKIDENCNAWTFFWFWGMMGLTGVELVELPSGTAQYSFGTFTGIAERVARQRSTERLGKAGHTSQAAK